MVILSRFWKPLKQQYCMFPQNSIVQTMTVPTQVSLTFPCSSKSVLCCFQADVIWGQCVCVCVCFLWNKSFLHSPQQLRDCVLLYTAEITFIIVHNDAFILTSQCWAHVTRPSHTISDFSLALSWRWNCIHLVHFSLNIYF